MGLAANQGIRENPSATRRRTAKEPNPTPVLLRLSIFLGVTAGFSLGLILVWALALGQASDIPWAPLTQVHGQVQVLGFTTLFILGTAAQVLPGFLSHPLRNRRRIILGGWILTGGLLARAVSQPLEPSLGRSILLAGSGVAELIGVGLCLLVYADLARRSLQPPDLWQTFAKTAFAFLSVSLLLNLGAVTILAGGAPMVPEWLDGGLVNLQLSGFIVLMVFAVSRRILPRFLLLGPPNDRLVRPGALLYVAGVVAESIGWILGAEPSLYPISEGLRVGAALPRLAGIVLILVGLRLYGRPIRASGAPNVTEPARRWFRLAFAWLLVTEALGSYWAARALFGGHLASYFELTAQRHALAQGFILLVIVSFGARILPGFSAWATTHPRFTEGLVISFAGGAALRVIGELLTVTQGYSTEVLAGAGGALGVAAFLIFAYTLIRALAEPPGAGRRSAPPPEPVKS